MSTLARIEAFRKSIETLLERYEQQRKDNEHLRAEYDRKIEEIIKLKEEKRELQEQLSNARKAKELLGAATEGGDKSQLRKTLQQMIKNIDQATSIIKSGWIEK